MCCAFRYQTKQSGGNVISSKIKITKRKKHGKVKSWNYRSKTAITKVLNLFSPCTILDSTVVSVLSFIRCAYVLWICFRGNDLKPLIYGFNYFLLQQASSLLSLKVTLLTEWDFKDMIYWPYNFLVLLLALCTPVVFITPKCAD